MAAQLSILVLFRGCCCLPCVFLTWYCRRHVKRLRRLYSNKNTLLRQALTEIFGSRVIVRAYESGLHLRLAVVTQQTADTLSERALENGVRILPVYDSNGNLPEILLSFVGIQENDIRPALLQLKKAWF